MRTCVPLVLLTLLAASAASGASPRVTAKLVAATHDLSAGVPWSARVQLHANGRALTATDTDEANAGKLRNLLRKAGIGQIFDLRQGHGVGGHGQRHDRRVTNR